MKLYSETGDFKLYQGNMLDMLEDIQPNSIDSIVTDPPYGLTSITKRFGAENSAPNVYGKDGSFARLTKGFMGKAWDGSGIEYNVEAWRKCWQVLKHGGYLLAFGGTRTFHRIACAIEDAGFEIRDTIMWLYGSGFPKSLNIGLMIDKKNGIESPVVAKGRSGAAESHSVCITGDDFGGEYEIRQAQNEWAGWGTALKPAYEPVIVARKPCEGSCIDNVMQYRTGAINIDECRVGDELIKGGTMPVMGSGEQGVCEFNTIGAERAEGADHVGKYPSNVILTYDETDADEVCGGMPNTKGTDNLRINSNDGKNYNCYGNYGDCVTTGYADEGSAARYFYCAKASKRDRDEGLEAFIEQRTTDGSLRCNEDTARMFGANSSLHRNTHTTVKPCNLMQYLVRLVTPRGGIILDPFNGSGSTGKAAMYENKDRQANYRYIGIELTKEYLPIADARIRYASNNNVPIETLDKPLAGQVTFDDLLTGGAQTD